MYHAAIDISPISLLITQGHGLSFMVTLQSQDIHDAWHTEGAQYGSVE